MTFPPPQRSDTRPELVLSEWERGIAVTSTSDTSVRMYLWFWEWNMFGAIEAGQHTHGDFENGRQVAEDGLSAAITTQYEISLSLEVGAQGVDLDLNVTNSSDRQWGDLASIIPCFSPGPEEVRTETFRTTKTSFVGAEGFDRLKAREIHFNEDLWESVLAEEGSGPFPWANKWPTAHTNATGGLMIRESSDERWVTGIAWDRYLSAQGNNPWECMHLAVQVGPLAPNETRNVRGSIYLFAGTKEDVAERFDRRDGLKR